jgi:hypothetical protein
MAQLSKGETFADSQQLTATRLNQLVDSAQLLVGAITDQPSITANTLEATDTTIVNDAGTLKEATISDILNSGLPITSAVINAPATNDIVVTPFDSASVAGSSYVSGDGLTVVVTTLAAHGLVVNNVVLISGAGTGYNGTFKITAVTSLTFTYVIFTAATPTASPTACTYVRKASEIVNGNIVATGSAFVGNKLDTLDLEVKGTASIKTANITTAVQYSGVPVLGLVSVDEFAIPFDQANATTEPLRVSTCNQWRVITSLTSLTKTNKEVWVIEADFPLNYWSFYATKFSLHQLSTSTNLALEVAFMQQAAAYVQYSVQQVKMKCVIPAGVTFTGETIQLRFRYNAGTALAGAIANVGFGGSLSDSDITKTLRVTKYIKP